MSLANVANAQRLVERAHFAWIKGEQSVQEAAGLSRQAVTLLTETLRHPTPLDVDPHALAHLCAAAMELHGRITSMERPSIDERLLWLASLVNGSLRPPVTENVLFIEPEDLDPATLPLSDHQQCLLKEWRAPFSEAFVDYSSSWTLAGVRHLCQDLLQDCSFVTSLISLSRNNAELLFDGVYPHSPSPRYGVVLHFNGCRRLVEVSCELPYLDRSHSLFVRSRTNDSLYWPAILEKAYLTIQGNGYDSKGSNTSIDTFLASGWLPEFLSAAQAPPMAQLWDSLYDHFQQNRLLLAVGTGDTPTDQFTPRHDYAITELIANTKSVVIKNPWMESVTVIKFSDIFSHFDTLYLNWNPASYKHHKSINLIWNNPHKAFYHSPQVHIKNADLTRSAEIRILLEKHQGYKPSTINLTTYRTKGERIFSKNMRYSSGESVGNNTGFHLSTITLAPGESCTAVISNDSTTLENFTLHTYSQVLLVLERSSNKYPVLKTLEDSWDVDSCGGNWSYQSYVKNPQYELFISEFHKDVNLQIGLFTEEDILVNAQLFFWDDGKPFAQKPSIINEKYQPGSLTTCVVLKPNQKYKLIISTFDQDIHAKFKLVLNSEVPISVSRISARLGLFVKPFAFSWNNKNRFRVTFKVSRETSVKIHIWSHGNLSDYRPKLRASLFYKDATPIQINEEFDANLYGIWTRKVSVHPGQEIIMLVERFETGNGEILGEIGSDYKIELVK